MAKHVKGSKLGGWTLESRLGEGGNGVVWGCHSADGARAALKVLKSYLLESTSNADEQKRRSRRTNRFLDEIRFLQSRQNSGIIPLVDAHLPDDPSTTNPPWLVMPLGESLPVYLSGNGRALTDVVRIFREVAAALSALHADGVAHRDIKPENVVLVDGSPFLSDFGLVQFDEKDPNTSESEILGPLFFVAPEMMGGAAEIDARPADVYAFAKSLWVAATGQQFPLPGEQRIGSPALTLSAYVSDQRANLLDKVIDACTRHSPEERPSASDVLAELTAWSRPEKTAAEPIAAVMNIARSFTSTVATTRDEFDVRRQMCGWGADLMDTAASLLIPLVEALDNFGFTDHEGRPLPARVIKGKGNRIWDQWTYPDLLVEETGDVVWRGAAGTIAQFVQPRGPTALLVSGIRILVRGDESVALCAAHVCIADGGMKDSQVVWRADDTSQSGSAVADAAVRALVTELLDQSPQAAEAFGSMIQEVIAARASSI